MESEETPKEEAVEENFKVKETTTEKGAGCPTSESSTREATEFPVEGHTNIQESEVVA